MSTTFNMNLVEGTRVEIGFGKVTEGEEAWMYGEYFPAVRPAFNDAGLAMLGSFAILATNTEGVAPVQGSFSCWPSAEAREKLHLDPRFVKVRPRRDASFDVFSDGHLFRPTNQTVEVSTDHDYAVVISGTSPLDASPTFELPLADDSPAQMYSGRSIRLFPWSDAAAHLLTGSPDKTTVLRIRFNPQG